jgi:long-chain acyl-CoA synthetase
MSIASVPALAPPAVTADARATLARLFWDRVGATPDRDAQIVRRGGAWKRSTWAEVGEVVGEVARGFLALGRRPGDAIGILARSRAEWVQADFAIFSAGGVTVPIYATSIPEEIAYIVNDANVRTLIVEGGTPLLHALEARRHMPGLEHLVVIGGDGERGEQVVTWETLRNLGRPHPELQRRLDERMAGVRADDVATIVYTSGTTGTPKGVVQTHRNHLAMLRALAALPGVQAGDVHLLFLPLAHAFARMEAFLGVHRGLVTAFAEDFKRLATDLREVQPDFLFAVPRVFETAHARIADAAETASRIRRLLFRSAIGIGRRASALRQEGRPAPWRVRVAHAIARRVVLGRLTAAFGGRLRFAVSGGAPLEREVGEFFHAIGIPILEGYGLTEACPVLTWNRLDRFKLGSVGQALPGIDLRLAPDGEILARGPNIARGYLNKPAETAAVFGADGWLHTGDIGRMDDEGFLFITDRKKDLIVTSGGVNVAPQPIEAALRRSPMIAEAVLYGDRRPYLAALLTLERDAVERFARAHAIGATEWAALVQHPAVLDHVQALVEAANETLPRHARVRRFAIVPGPFTEAGGELTPTQKVKRRVVAERYGELLAGLYR